MAWSKSLNAKHTTGRAWSNELNAKHVTALQWVSSLNARHTIKQGWDSQLNARHTTGRSWATSLNAHHQILLVPAGIPVPPTAGGTIGEVVECFPLPSITLVGPTGELELLSWSITCAIEQGWTWSATVEGLLDSFAREGLFRFTIDDGMGGVLVTPPLVANQPRRPSSDLSGDRTELGGTDLATYRAGLEGQSFDSYFSSDSAIIAAAVASRAGISISGFPSFPVGEEEVKSAKLWDSLNRMARSRGYIWFIDPHGTVRFLPFQAGSVSGYQFPAGSISRDDDPGARITEIVFGKESRVTTTFEKWFDTTGPHEFQFPSPLSAVTVKDISTSGYIETVSLFDGPPLNGDSGHIGTKVLAPLTFNITPTRSGAYPATHGVARVGPPSIAEAAVVAGIRVSGAPPDNLPEGLDRSFLVTYPPGGDPTRPDPAPRVDPLFTSAADMQGGVGARIFAYENRASNVMHYEGAPLLASVRLWETVSRPGWPSASIYSINWNDPGPGGAPTTSISAYVL
ncbi:MAG: hypothetical protein AB7S38_29050 [Vulcanimicrobiota bacterium]